MTTTPAPLRYFREVILDSEGQPLADGSVKIYLLRGALQWSGPLDDDSAYVILVPQKYYGVRFDVRVFVVDVEQPALRHTITMIPNWNPPTVQV